MINKGSNTDKELFFLVAEGDEAAFEQLYNKFLPELYTTIFTIVKTETVVKDIIQEVFLYLWMDREKLADVEQPRNWIFKITYNRSYTWLKKQIAQERINKKLLDEQGELSLFSITEENVHFAEATRIIQEAIYQLPAKSQKIYRLSREEGLKPAAIAQELDMSVQVVKNSLYRSGKTIKSYLADHGIVIPIVILVGRL